MKRLSTQSPQFQQELQSLLAFETAQDPKIDQIVADICADVQRRGDAAVLEYTNRFDGTQAQTMADLTLSQDDLKAAFFRLPENVQTALQTAAERVRSYHQHQNKNRGVTPMPTARCWGSKSRRWIAWGFMCRAARRRIPAA